MSVARGGQNGGHYYSNIVMPQEIDVSFTVALADSGGLGVTGLKSNGWVRNVFMKTSATPGVGNASVTNPNPATGFVYIQLRQNFNVFLGMNYLLNPPTTGAALTSTTAGTVYVINALGTTTAAQWITSGLPRGQTAAVGQAYVALVTASIGGTGSVKVPTTSGVFAAEVVGLPNTMINNSIIETNGGGFLILQLLNASGTPVQPTASSVVNLNLFFDRSSVTVDGL